MQSAYKTVMDWWVYHTAVLPTLAEIAQAFQQTRKQAAVHLPQAGADLAPAPPLPAPRARAYAASGAAIVAEGAAKACLAVRPQGEPLETGDSEARLKRQSSAPCSPQALASEAEASGPRKQVIGAGAAGVRAFHVSCVVLG